MSPRRVARLGRDHPVSPTRTRWSPRRNRIAAEHVEVLTHEPRRYLDRLSKYGAWFLGPETNVRTATR